MTSASPEAMTVPAGVWAADPVHSSIAFAVEHAGTASFRCGFGDYEATLNEGVLEGVVRADSIAIWLDDFKTHLLGPDFFDVQRTPTLGFRSTTLELAEDGALTVDGELTIKGTTRPMRAEGRLVGPLEGLNGRNRLGIELETSVDRFDFGINFDMRLPDGRPLVGDAVRIEIVLEVVETRRDPPAR